MQKSENNLKTKCPQKKNVIFAIFVYRLYIDETVTKKCLFVTRHFFKKVTPKPNFGGKI